MKSFKTTKKVAQELATAIATGVCGHAPDKLSPEAQRLYKKMLACDFKCEIVIPVKP